MSKCYIFPINSMPVTVGTLLSVYYVSNILPSARFPNSKVFKLLSHCSKRKLLKRTVIVLKRTYCNVTQEILAIIFYEENK